MAKQPDSQPPSPSLITSFFTKPLPVYLSAAILRVVLLVYGLWQDANSPLKYTDIDYLVFTDAARFVSRGQSPYDRETYRYTPVLAWLLLPTAHTTGNPLWDVVWFSSGKVLFAVADLVAGWLLVRLLTMEGVGKKAMDATTARKFAAIWLLNPMVATISTRGSSEGLLGVLVTALLWAVLARRVTLAGLLLGFGVHFKIYPFIYAPAIVWWMDAERMATIPGKPGKKTGQKGGPLSLILSFVTPERLRLTAVSLATFLGLNLVMYSMYVSSLWSEKHHTNLLTISLNKLRKTLPPTHIPPPRHPHRPSPQLQPLQHPTLPHLRLPRALHPTNRIRGLPPATPSILRPDTTGNGQKGPPHRYARPDIRLCHVQQGLHQSGMNPPPFQCFSVLIHSQEYSLKHLTITKYFLWYMIFLPLYLPASSFLQHKAKLGVPALALWVLSQGAWLQQGYELEFLGQSTFLPGLWLASLGFFLVNCWILGVIVVDTKSK